MLIRKADAPNTALEWLRPLGWSMVGLMLAVPLLAMQFEERLHLGVRWTASDFAVAALLLGVTGAALELAVRANGSRAYRAGAFLGTGAALALVWINLAVGLVGAEGNPANMWFMLVPLVGLAGAALARFEAQGTARAMLAMVVAQIAAGLLAGGGMQALAITLAWGSCWLASAWLFRRAG
ncbi:hypothetical protein [Novosphingobium sp. B1]|uniref:hypothetical protein n=1 Tax=Novosphingobium sp. B1 TaxID=1938756 RepID=UPI0009D8F10A|nr:hypothetical protein [Novosphingobium sp. B1]SMC47901.1 hypothetical protein SAMN06272759_103153 [Novosphingobium sp. B1]